MNRRVWTVIGLTALLVTLVVMPTSASNTMTYYGYSQVGAYTMSGFSGDWLKDPTPGSPNGEKDVLYLSVCPAMVTATIDGNEITVTVVSPESGPGLIPGVLCYDPVFNGVTPLTFTGHLAAGTGDRIRGQEFPLVLQPDGSTGTMLQRFEALTGCTATQSGFQTIRGYWTTGTEGGLIVYWRAQCDEVYGIPAPKTTVQWGWGFLGFAP
jgi:hypothetical protein